MKIIIGQAFIRKAAGYLILLPLFTLTSCDPMQSLIIQNQTGGEATVTFVFKPGDRYYKFNESSQSDTLIVDLDTTSTQAEQIFHFGLGTWEIQSSFDSLVATVERIEVKTRQSTETFQGAQQVRAFFESGRSRKHKELIAIILE